MKKLLVILFFLNSICFASHKLRVEAMEDFDSVNPAKELRVKIIKDSHIGSLPILTNDILNCEIQKITDPKRAKRDARIYCILKSYEDNLGVHPFNDVYIAKYAKTSMKENRKKIIKTAITTAGGLVVKGLSFGVSFVEGVKKNEENNRIKSGFKKMYDDSLFSYIEYGDELSIKQGDMFYFIIKKADEEETED